MTVAPEVSELDHLALLGGKAEERTADPRLGQSMLDGGPCVGRSWSVDNILFYGRRLRSCSLTTENIEASVAHDCDQPRPERSSLRIIGRGAPPYLKEALLHSVLRALPIAQNLRGETQCETAVPIVEDFNRGMVTLQHHLPYHFIVEVVVDRFDCHCHLMLHASRSLRGLSQPPRAAMRSPIGLDHGDSLKRFWSIF